LQERALTDGLDDESQGDGQEDGNGKQSEELELVGLARMAQDDDQIEPEDPEKKNRDEKCEFGEGAEHHGAGRVLEDEVAVGVQPSAGPERLRGTGFGGKREHRGEYRTSSRQGKWRVVGEELLVEGRS